MYSGYVINFGSSAGRADKSWRGSIFPSRCKPHKIQQPTRHWAGWAVRGTSNDLLRSFVLVEVAWSSFAAVALVADGKVFQLAFGKYRFHLDLPSAGAEKLLCNHVDPSVLANFRHMFSSSSISKILFRYGLPCARSPILTEWKSTCPP